MALSQRNRPPLKLINVTGHPVYLTDGVAETRLESDGRARVHHIDILVDHVNVDGLTIPILNVKEQTVYGLPEPEEGVLYVVSGIAQVVARDNGRTDVVAPGRFLREGKTVKGARAFVRIVKGSDNG